MVGLLFVDFGLSRQSNLVLLSVSSVLVKISLIVLLILLLCTDASAELADLSEQTSLKNLEPLLDHVLS